MTSIFRWPRHAQWLLVLLPLVFLLGGCDSGGANYTETGDLESLRERDQLRLLAPRFDEEQGVGGEAVACGELACLTIDLARGGSERCSDHREVGERLM